MLRGREFRTGIVGSLVSEPNRLSVVVVAIVSGIWGTQRDMLRDLDDRSVEMEVRTLAEVCFVLET